MGDRTEAGNVTAERRRKSGLRDKQGRPTGRFPIFDRRSALAALRLRGHARTRAERRRIIERAMKYTPAEAREAMEKDKQEGAID